MTTQNLPQTGGLGKKSILCQPPPRNAPLFRGNPIQSEDIRGPAQEDQEPGGDSAASEARRQKCVMVALGVFVVLLIAFSVLAMCLVWAKVQAPF